MEKFVSALHATRDTIRLKIDVAQNEILKEKTFSIESTTRENESLETLNSVEKLCKEAKAKMR